MENNNISKMNVTMIVSFWDKNSNTQAGQQFRISPKFNIESYDNHCEVYWELANKDELLSGMKSLFKQNDLTEEETTFINDVVSKTHSHPAYIIAGLISALNMYKGGTFVGDDESSFHVDTTVVDVDAPLVVTLPGQELVISNKINHLISIMVPTAVGVLRDKQSLNALTMDSSRLDDWIGLEAESQKLEEIISLFFLERNTPVFATCSLLRFMATRLEVTEDHKKLLQEALNEPLYDADIEFEIHGSKKGLIYDVKLMTREFDVIIKCGTIDDTSLSINWKCDNNEVFYTLQDHHYHDLRQHLVELRTAIFDDFTF